jgi:hypothetical protein
MDLAGGLEGGELENKSSMFGILSGDPSTMSSDTRLDGEKSVAKGVTN